MPEHEIYLDNAATTRTDPDIAEAMARDMVALYANPSSVHRPGLAAARRLEEARRALEERFPGYAVVFTASGSESLNLALKGAFFRRRKGADRIVASAVEHPAVLNGARDLGPLGARTDLVGVTADGRIDLGALDACLARADDVALVAIMQVQNELGSLQPLAEAGRIVRARAPRAAFLVDAVQGLGKAPVEPETWCADAVALASHKIHGPKGVGALLVRKGLPLAPLISGGGQEGGIRSGTQNVAGCAAFATAAVRALDGLRAHVATLARLRERLRAGILAGTTDVAENGPVEPEHASPAILNVSIANVPSEVLLHSLEQDGIYVSAGSACHSKGKPANHIHQAIGLPEWRSRSAIRFGLSWHNTDAEIERTLERLAARVAEVRRISLAPAR